MLALVPAQLQILPVGCAPPASSTYPSHSAPRVPIQHPPESFSAGVGEEDWESAGTRRPPALALPHMLTPVPRCAGLPCFLKGGGGGASRLGGGYPEEGPGPEGGVQNMPAPGPSICGRGSCCCCCCCCCCCSLTWMVLNEGICRPCRPAPGPHASSPLPLQPPGPVVSLPSTAPVGPGGALMQSTPASSTSARSMLMLIPMSSRP